MEYLSLIALLAKGVDFIQGELTEAAQMPRLRAAFGAMTMQLNS
jgi:hypothetical protein